MVINVGSEHLRYEVIVQLTLSSSGQCMHLSEYKCSGKKQRVFPSHVSICSGGANHVQ